VQYLSVIAFLLVAILVSACQTTADVKPYPADWNPLALNTSCEKVAGSYSDQAVRTTYWENPRNASSASAYLSALLRFGTPRPTKIGESTFSSVRISRWPDKRIVLSRGDTELSLDVLDVTCTETGTVVVRLPMRQLSGEHSAAMTAQTTLEFVSTVGGELVARVRSVSSGPSLAGIPDRAEFVEWAVFEALRAP
jgi:hypothetical protein